jgi:hypothetical protein
MSWNRDVLRTVNMRIKTEYYLEYNAHLPYFSRSLAA